MTLIALNGRIVELQAFGSLDREKQLPMRKDAIFRIASQTKAVTSIAVLMLHEEGKLLLSDPVSKYIPSFKKTVAVSPAPGAPASAPIAIVAAKREITLHDLLTHTSGISYGDKGPAAAQWKTAGLDWDFCGHIDETIGALVERTGNGRWDAQPGEKFVYGHSIEPLANLSALPNCRRRRDPSRWSNGRQRVTLSPRERRVCAIYSDPRMSTQGRERVDVCWMEMTTTQNVFDLRCWSPCALELDR